MEKEIFRPDEIAQKLSVTTRTIYNWINKGALKAIKLPSGTYRIKKKDFEAFLLYRSTQNDTDFTVFSSPS